MHHIQPVSTRSHHSTERADRRQPTGSTAITAVIAAQLRTGVSVNRPRDHSVRTPGLMLVDHRGMLAVMTHPRHQVTQPCAAGRRPGVARMAQIMKVQAARSDRGHRLWPARLPVEVSGGPFLGCAGGPLP
jgi:hypothetical protein